MSDHYYTKNPNVKSDETTWTFPLKGKDFRFITDAGVFSKGTVDFGSRLLIDTFKLPEETTGPILDVGCGYGPMGLSLAYAYPDRMVEMVDVNERAMALARRNAAANHISNIKVYESSAYASVEGKNRFAAIVTNPPIRAGKQVVHQILSEAYDYLEDNGSLTAVIQKKQGAPSAQKLMEEVFGNVEVIAKDKGYWILQSLK
ncbi:MULTISPECIES: class I SAM-dependent methyltransferase [Jeotgalibaca]|uniref:class I SAM-dependent methyltransferase n=1 Tax=Jeotgalibaca TaxID=1470540 RepID=UPI00359F8D7D